MGEWGMRKLGKYAEWARRERNALASEASAGQTALTCIKSELRLPVPDLAVIAGHIAEYEERVGHQV
jgi:hypothetical protein